VRLLIGTTKQQMDIYDRNETGILTYFFTPCKSNLLR